MRDHYIAWFFFKKKVYYIYEIMIVSEWHEDFEAPTNKASADFAMYVYLKMTMQKLFVTW